MNGKSIYTDWLRRIYKLLILLPFSESGAICSKCLTIASMVSSCQWKWETIWSRCEDVEQKMMLNCDSSNPVHPKEQMELIIYHPIKNLVLDLPLFQWLSFTLQITREKIPYRTYTVFFFFLLVCPWLSPYCNRIILFFWDRWQSTNILK